MRPNLNTRKGTGFFLSQEDACPSKQKGRSAKAGVTLIELIMAMVILTAVSIPMGAMIGAQIQGMMTSTDLTAAGNLARQKMEGLINLLSDNVPPYTQYANVVTGSSTVGLYDLAWTVTPVVSGIAERKDITLTAKRTGTSAILVTLHGSVAKGVSYAA
ncbi:MAG: prepilin-type N-terminal cleavage/methylation domain-containing protein [Candidatus Omnitrophica bacterium]|nr:prepilin-type N-terminal cleavage/methylation domain-containing protein [Candidatus Omnitrophota bacterium]